MTHSTGSVKWFDQARGYGFIAAESGEDVFVHHSQVKEQTQDKNLREGEQVRFDMIKNEEGIGAINVFKV